MVVKLRLWVEQATRFVDSEEGEPWGLRAWGLGFGISAAFGLGFFVFGISKLGIQRQVQCKRGSNKRQPSALTADSPRIPGFGGSTHRPLSSSSLLFLFGILSGNPVFNSGVSWHPN